jgi:hypothetical protein
MTAATVKQCREENRQAGGKPADRAARRQCRLVSGISMKKRPATFVTTLRLQRACAYGHALLRLAAHAARCAPVHIGCGGTLRSICGTFISAHHLPLWRACWRAARHGVWRKRRRGENLLAAQNKAASGENGHKNRQ